jgi:hypothetical protein
MVADFELANGGGFGLSLGQDTFDEGVDLDTLLTGLQLRSSSSGSPRSGGGLLRSRSRTRAGRR